MAMIRVIPTAKSTSAVVVNGRTYTPTPNLPQDVLAADAEVLAVNGWLRVGLAGATEQRPGANPAVGAYMAQAGAVFVDTTLGAVLMHDGAAWRNALTGAVA